MVALDPRTLVEGRRSVVRWRRVLVANVMLAPLAIFVIMMYRLAAHERVMSTRMMIERVEEAVAVYKAGHRGACPPDLAAAGAHVHDLWGEPLSFKCPGIHDESSADIVSSGPDRVLGTADDVWSWGVQ